ncbi:MAG: hypothetical protein AAGM67_00635 [Bacteroidota bacterium]
MILFIFVVFIVSLAFILARKSMDKDHVRLWVERQGGRLISQQWTPFGNGWEGENRERLYTIVYVDREGNRRRAELKTSLGTGVYVRSNQIISRANKSVNSAKNDPFAQGMLAAENRRLKAELAKLKAQQKA